MVVRKVWLGGKQSVVHVARVVAPGFFAALVTGCGGGDAGARLAAVQAAMEKTPPTLTVPSGHFCFVDGERAELNPDRFRGLPFVRTKPAGEIFGIFKPSKCTDVTWSKEADVPRDTSSQTAEVKLGRWVVDKVGADREGGLGAKVAPFRVHFEPNRIGSALIAAKLAIAPRSSDDAAVALDKDADGKWVAHL